MEVSGASGVDVEVSSIADSDITGDLAGDGGGYRGWGDADLIGDGAGEDGVPHALRQSLTRQPSSSQYSPLRSPISDLDAPLSEISFQAQVDNDSVLDDLENFEIQNT